MSEMVCYGEGKKYMWDGQEYDSEDKAAVAEKEYLKKGFETWTVRKGGKVFLYTRRVVTEVVVEER
ncbi:MAG: hypothetical protein JSW27_06845 [Phycisphaerales bacterium]|nr:MAG: hypothetical protein JSW27_06845 [Phycisphaerales bacterium]